LLLVTIIEAASVFSIAPIVDFLIKPDLQNASHITLRAVTLLASIGIPATLWGFLIVFLALNIMKSGFQIFAMNLMVRTKYSVHRDIMLGTFEDFFAARWYFFSSSEQGKLLNTFIREMNFIGDSFAAMGRLFSNILQLVLYIAIPFYLSWQVMSVSLASILVFALPFMLIGKINYRLGRKSLTTANQMSTTIQESFASAKVILGFANQHKSVEDLRRNFDAHRNAAVKSQTLRYSVPIMYYPLGFVALSFGLIMAQKLSFPLSELTVLVYCLFRIVPLVGRFMGEKSTIENFFPSFEQVINLRQRAKQLKQTTGTRNFTGFESEITIEDLSFAFPAHKPNLIDINVRIPEGRMIAIVGESGAGKSTLIDTIMGFNEPLKGKITIDGIPIQEFDIKSYRQRIGYVAQETILFNMTIDDNLRWANGAAKIEDIKEACRQANAHEFIKEFPDRYDTVVGDRGVRLSGGQVQRIALARAILRKPELLILDEATSSLDTRSERLIQEAIDNIAKRTTVIAIAHRLSTIVGADYVYVLKKGRVVEEGPYLQLVEMNGYFSHMVQSQMLEAAN